MTEFSAQVVLGESLTPVGHLRFTQSGPRQFSTFSYDTAWMKDPRAFALQPDMPFKGGPFHASAQPGNSGDALAGAFSDAAPDSWGRRLLERAYGKGLSEFEYLTLSDDTCRQGALRFVDGQGNIITGNSAEAFPRLLDLQTITAIARAYEQGKEISAQDMWVLAGAGGSGGARPKANVRGDGALWLAKFTSIHDQQPIEQIEVATLRLAKSCGIRTPEVRLELADTPFPVALLQRFDRRDRARIPYISARTALGKTGTKLGSYTEIVDFMREAAFDPKADFQELYRRLVFTILVSNKDDHLKNHGFLYVGSGRWRLSPVFDVNPTPDRNPYLETAIMEGGGHNRSIKLALEACEFFEISDAAARQIIRDIAQRISDEWREALRQVGVTGIKARDYELAFMNEETEIAVGL
jgi:serine/threonine-protein kinase HipA